MDALKKLGKKLGVGLLAIMLNNVAIADAITYFHNDISGSPMAATDAAGNLLWKENYKPYGDKLNRSASSSGNKIGYHGKVHDDATGLSYMSARYYDPVLGRFMGVDPVDFQVDNLHSFNRYTYANNNPYKYVDPDGRMSLLLPIYNALLALVTGLTANTLLNGGQTGSDGFNSEGGSSGSDIGNPSTWSTGRVHNEQDGTNSRAPMLATPPSDAKDPNGAKAPGKPGEAEGFKDPKTGENWVPNPNPGKGGGNNGWLDNKGNVWVPTGRGGNAHGGPHWDVQKTGGGYENVYPERK